jgi:hypothetical protein
MVMTDERLAEIEEIGCDHSQLCEGERQELVAEVRRLHRALRLSEASRGVLRSSMQSVGHHPDGSDRPHSMGSDCWCVTSAVGEGR